MKLFHSTGWQDFWMPDQAVEQVLLTTFGFDPDFFYDQVIPLLFGITEEPGTIEHELSIREQAKKIVVFMDKDQYTNSFANKKPCRFINSGGRIVPVMGKTQHSKLWLIKLEKTTRISIGSTNITKSGFSQQIQYMWMSELKKSDKKSKQGEVLANFISHLSDDKKILKDWTQQLINTIYPEGIEFVPVIPADKKSGFNIVKNFIKRKKNRKKDNDYELWIQSFSVGKLNGKFLCEMKNVFHVESINLLWPHEQDIINNSKWVKMILSDSAACHFLKTDYCHLWRLNFDDKYLQLTKKNRLPHGKLFAIWDKRNDKSKYIILGSSNFSLSGWEKNLELNILIDEEFDIDWLWYDPEKLTKPFTQQVPNKYQNNDILFFDHNIEQEKISAIFFTQNKKLNSIDYTLLDKNNEVIMKNMNILLKENQCCIYLDNSSFYKICIYEPETQELLVEGWIPRPFDIELNFSVSQTRFIEMKHEWILKKYGWTPNRQRSGEYRVSWVEKGLNLLSIVDHLKEELYQNNLNKVYISKKFDEINDALVYKREQTQSQNEKTQWNMAIAELNILQISYE